MINSSDDGSWMKTHGMVEKRRRGNFFGRSRRR